MRILVLGAGALGGYFGGRLAEAGGDVTFLVRPKRAMQLAERGLVLESQFGNATLRVNTVGEAGPGYDLVLLTCKAYDLDAAIEAIRPAMQEGTAVLPVLNGLSHVDTLTKAFGAENVLGGLAKIQATMAADGTVKQLNDWRWLTFGELDGRMSGRVLALVGGYMIALGHQVMQAVGPNLPVAAVLPLSIAALAVLPLWPGLRVKTARVAAALCLMLAVGVALTVRLDPLADTVPVYSADK